MASTRPWYYFKRKREEALQDALKDCAFPEAATEQQEEASGPLPEDSPSINVSSELLKRIEELEAYFSDIARRLQNLESLFNQMDASIRTLDVQATLDPRR